MKNQYLLPSIILGVCFIVSSFVLHAGLITFGKSVESGCKNINYGLNNSSTQIPYNFFVEIGNRSGEPFKIKAVDLNKNKKQKQK